MAGQERLKLIVQENFLNAKSFAEYISLKPCQAGINYCSERPWLI